MDKYIRKYCLLLYSFYQQDHSKLGPALDALIKKAGQEALSNAEIWNTSSILLTNRQQECQELSSRLSAELLSEIDDILKNSGVDRNRNNATPSGRNHPEQTGLPRKAPRSRQSSNAELLRSTGQHSIPRPVKALHSFYRNTLKPAVQKTGRKIKAYQYQTLHLLILIIILGILSALITLRYFTSPYHKASIRLNVITSNIKNKKFLDIRARIKEYESEYITPLDSEDQARLMSRLTNKLHEQPNSFRALHYFENQEANKYPQFLKVYRMFLEQFPETNTSYYNNYKKLNADWKRRYEEQQRIQDEYDNYKRIKNIKDLESFTIEVNRFKDKYPGSRFIESLQHRLKNMEYEEIGKLQDGKD